MSPRHGPWRRAACALVSGVVGLQTGCGTILFQPNIPVDVVCSNVDTATFAAPRRGLSTRSGGVLVLDRRQNYTLDVSAPGYVTRQVRVESEVSIWRGTLSVVLNLLHGVFTLFISTFIGVGADIKAGAWETLDPDPIVVELVPSPAPPAPGRPWPAPVTAEVCASCGMTLDPKVWFCSACGHKTR